MPLFNRKSRLIFSEDQTARLIAAIRDAEKQTSGEIRVYIERRCKYVDAMDRARQIFDLLEMEQTALRNGVLFYMAVKDRQLAIFGDEGIHQATGKEYWQDLLAHLIRSIKNEDIISGLVNAIGEIGLALKNHFPYDETTDKNELPDDIVFGK